MVIKSGHLNSDLKSIRNYLYFQLKIDFQFFNLSIIDLFNNFYTATQKKLKKYPFFLLKI